LESERALFRRRVRRWLVVERHLDCFDEEPVGFGDRVVEVVFVESGVDLNRNAQVSRFGGFLAVQAEVLK
jgi:hypothetical protein